MGEVYRAIQHWRELEHKELIGQEVALKIIRPDRISPQHLDCIVNEINSIKKVNHSGIVELKDVTRTEIGFPPISVPVIVTEVIHGVPITEFKFICEEEMLECFADLCDVIQEAHKARLIHCDLKPSNILVNHRRECKVLDFGLAKPLNSIATQVGCFFGTPEYCSPEQAYGGPIDQKTEHLLSGCHSI